MRRVFEEPTGQRDKKPMPKKGQQSSPEGADRTDAIVESLQRSAGNAAVGQLLAARGPASVGSPLPADVQARAERKLGADLSPVRLHTDSAADDYVRSANAEAATLGTDVYLGSQAADLSRADS